MGLADGFLAALHRPKLLHIAYSHRNARNEGLKNEELKNDGKKATTVRFYRIRSNVNPLLG